MAKKLLILSTAILSTIAISSLSFAEDCPEGRKFKRHGPPAIEEIDTNGDNAASFEEFTAWHNNRLENRFQKADADGNGLVTAEEFEEARAKKHQKRRKMRQRYKRQLREFDEE